MNKWRILILAVGSSLIVFTIYYSFNVKRFRIEKKLGIELNNLHAERIKEYRDNPDYNYPNVTFILLKGSKDEFFDLVKRLDLKPKTENNPAIWPYKPLGLGHIKQIPDWWPSVAPDSSLIDGNHYVYFPRVIIGLKKSNGAIAAFYSNSEIYMFIEMGYWVDPATYMNQ